MNRYAVHIVGHTTGPFGEVTNAAKLRQMLHNAGHGAVLHDIFDFGANWDVIKQKAEEARRAVSSGNVVHPDHRQDPRFAELRSRINMFTPPGHRPVQFFLTWPQNVKAFARMGLHRLAPTITRYYPPRIEGRDHDLKYLQHGDVLAVISPLGAIKAMQNGVPSHKIVFVPQTYNPDYAPGSTRVASQEEKQIFIKEVARSMGKTVNAPQDPVIFNAGLKKFETGNNIIEIIRAFREVHRRAPNAFLLVKDEEWRDKEQKEEFEQIVREVEKEPWFLWEKHRDPPETIMTKHLPLTDVSLVMSGLEGASTATVEAAAFGKPLVTLNASTHPYLFKGGAILVKAVVSSKRDKFGREIPVPDHDQLVSTLVDLAANKQLRDKWGKRALEMARARFSNERALDRFLLAARAAEVYRQGTEREKQEMRKRVEATLQRDLREFGVHR